MRKMIRFKFQACRAAQRELWDYAGERLAEGPMEQVERHLEVCASCRREVTEWKKAQNLLENAQAAPLPTARLGWRDLQARIASDVAAFGPPRPDKRHTRQVVAHLIPSRRANIPSWLRPALALGGMSLALALVLFANRAPRRLDKTPNAAPASGFGMPATLPSLAPSPDANSSLSSLLSDVYPPVALSEPPVVSAKSSPQQIAKSDAVKVRPASNRIAPAPPLPLKWRALKASAKSALPKVKAANHLSDSQNNDKIKFQPHEPTPEEKPLDNTEVAAGVIGTLVPVSNDDSNGYY